MTKPTFPVGIDIFVVRDGKLLLGKRNHGWSAGTWGLPGGHLEFKESMKACAARELVEETGMTAEDFVFTTVINNTSRTLEHYIHVNFVAKNPKGEPVVKEKDRFDEWRWFPLNDLPKDLFPPHIKQIELFIEGNANFADN